jgi:mannose-6-phosphate isomerase-like protein (cupin superfamily)/putative sterol carrier protein
MIKQTYSLIVIVLLAGFILTGVTSKENKHIKQDQPKKELGFMLQEWSKSFAVKIDSNYNAVVDFTSSETDEAYHVIFKNKTFTIHQNISGNANFAFKSTLEHYNKIYHGEMTGFTSVGRENMSDKTPLDGAMYRPVTDHLMNDVLFFIQRFFNTSPHDQVILRKENSRIVHGGHAIPLFYQQNNDIGVRSAWYLIQKGQQVNKTGDINPFPQYFIITKGSGFAKIGNDTLRVKANESYYIAPGLEHIFWNELDEPIEMIFLAWGKGA